MRAITKEPLFFLFGVFVALSYFAWLFMNWGSYSHGGTPTGRIFIDTVLVLSVFLGLKVIRSPFSLLVRVGSAIAVLPLALFAVAFLVDAIRFIVAQYQAV